MKREIKIRITYQHEDTGRITQRIIELGHPIPELGERWFAIGKDQFTGLHDKNGREIYEGDIMQHANPLDTPLEVMWSNDECAFVFNDGCTGFLITDSSFEVIGNIYENPELLN